MAHVSNTVQFLPPYHVATLRGVESFGFMGRRSLIPNTWLFFCFALLNMYVGA